METEHKRHKPKGGFFFKVPLIEKAFIEKRRCAK